MKELCVFHHKPFSFFCCEPSCFKFLCFSCINDHQKTCHYPNNTYQELKLIEDLENVLNERVNKIYENVSKIFLHKKDLLLNYFFDQISEITTYYFENLNKSISLEPLDIVQLSAGDFFKEIKEKLSNFVNKNEKNQDDYINILQETEVKTTIEKLKKREINSAKQKFPDLKKNFDETQNIINEIEHCFLDFKKKVFSESYASEMNQMLNFLSHTEEKEKETMEIPEKLPDINLSEHEIKQMLMTIEEKEPFEEKKEENIENNGKIQKIIEQMTNELIQQVSQINEKKETKEILEKEGFSIISQEKNFEKKEEILLKDQGLFIDYELEAFDYELESLNPENGYLFLYHLPEITSDYFIDVLDLGCKRIFNDDFSGVISAEEGTLKTKNYKIFLTSGEIKKIENSNEEIEVYQINLEFKDNTKCELLFRKQGLQLILPFDEKLPMKFLLQKDESENEILYTEEILKTINEKYAVKLKEELILRRPLHFHFRRYLIQINEAFDKLRIIDKALGFRVFLRNFDQSLSLVDFNSDMIFEYVASNSMNILHLDELDIFMNISQHSNFIIFNNKFHDLMICNLETPELIIFYLDLWYKEYKNDEMPLETLLKNFLFNANIKFKSFVEGSIYSQKLEVLLENGDIESIYNTHGIGVICCNFTMKLGENLKVKSIFVLKQSNRLILAFEEKTMIKYQEEKENKPVAPYDEDLTAILRISHYFLKINVKHFSDSIITFEKYFIIYIVSDNSSFFLKNLQNNDKKVQLFYQHFEPDQKKYQTITDEFLVTLNSLSECIYKEADHIQFLYKIKSKDLFVRWNGNTMNLFNLGNKKYEIPKSSKPLYRKIDKEKRPETLKTEDILTAENEI